MSERVIALIGGDSGTGKSFFIANLKRALIVDTDLGGGLSDYEARIAKNGSERIVLNTYPEVLEELKRRHQAGKLKDFSTVALDHVSSMQQESSIRHNPSLERDFGRSNDVATREWRKIREFAKQQDFNLFAVSHMKVKWQDEKAVGMTHDGGKNLEGDFKIVIQLRRSAQYPSTAWVQKWRRDPEDPRGQIPATFPFTMEAFEKLAGEGLLSPRKEIVLASAAQAAKLRELVVAANISVETTEKWLARAEAASFEEMTADAVTKCIDHIHKTLKPNMQKAG